MPSPRESNTTATATATRIPGVSWKTRLALSFFRMITKTAFRPDGTVNRRLLKAIEFNTPANPQPINGVKSHDVTVDPSRKLWFRVFTPTATTETLPVIVFFHGGGFAHLSVATRTYDAVCRRFARELTAVIVSVEYRLIPEHKFPAQYDDGFDALAYLEKHPEALPENADVSKCFLAGDSAGGNLAHQVAVRMSQAGFEKVKLIGLISIQPFFGGEERSESEIRLVNVPIIMTARTDWIWKAFFHDGSNRDHWAVNVSGPNAVSLSSLEYPNTIVFVGGLDPLQDWQRRYYEWLKSSGKEAAKVEYENMFHAFYVFSELPESAQLIQEAKDFMAKQLSKF